jgi:hypothetical protein
VTVAAPHPSHDPTAERRQWDKALARAWPDGDLSSLLFFERTLPHRRKQALQAIFRGREVLDRLDAVLDADAASLPAGVAVTPSPMHRGLPVDFEGDRVLVVRKGATTLCASIVDDELHVLLLDGPLPFSDRRVRYRPRSELEVAETIAAICVPTDLRFLRKPASRVDDRFSCPPDLEAGALLATTLDELVGSGSRYDAIVDAWIDCRDAEAELVATWSVRRELIAVLLSAAAWAQREASASRLVLEGLLVEHDGDVLRLSSTVTGETLVTPIALLHEGVLSITSRGWDGREHVLTIDRGRPVGRLPPLDALLDIAIELDDLEAQLLAIT